LRAQIVRVVLGSGAFSWNDTRLTAAILALFVVSLLGQSLMLLLIRTFYAGGNTRTPLYIALCSGVFSVVVAVVLVNFYSTSAAWQDFFTSVFRLEDVIGTEVLMLALAFMIGTFVEAVLLLVFAARAFGLQWSFLARQFLEASLAALVAGVSAYAALLFIVDGINQETFIGIFLQGAVAGLFGLVGALMAYFAVNSKELHEIYRSFRSRILKTDVIAPQSETL